MKLEYKKQVECKSQTGIVTVTFEDIEQDFLVSGLKINGSLRRFNLNFANYYDGNCFEIKFDENRFKVGEINEINQIINVPITKKTVITIDSVPFGEKLELLFYCKEQNISYELSGGHVPAHSVNRSIQPFFMVFADKPSNYNKVPTVRHATEEEAQVEALRIAEKEKCEVYIFKSLQKISLVPNIQKID